MKIYTEGMKKELKEPILQLKESYGIVILGWVNEDGTPICSLLRIGKHEVQVCCATKGCLEEGGYNTNELLWDPDGAVAVNTNG